MRRPLEGTPKSLGSAPATLALLEHIQAGMQELEESDREHFTLFVFAIVRSVIGASGLVRGIEDLKRQLSANDLIARQKHELGRTSRATINS